MFADKSRADKHGPFLVFCEWCNTPSEGMNVSPIQLLYGQRICTRLPVAKSLLVPQMLSIVLEKVYEVKTEVLL